MTWEMPTPWASLAPISADQQIGADRRQGRELGICPALRICRMNSAVGL